jgi:thioredoxin:protein disulfide reductase
MSCTMSDVFRRFAAGLALALALAGPAVAAELEGSAAASDTPSASSLNAILGANSGSNEADFLPADQAFQLDAFADGPDKVRLEWVIHEGYYLYKSRIKVGTKSTQAQLGAPALPKGKEKEDEYFGKQEVYHDELTASLPVARAAGGAIELPVDVTYQGCADKGLCYPPITKTLNVKLPGSAGTAAGAASSGGTASGGAGANAAGAPSSASASGAGTAAFVSEQDSMLSVLSTGSLWAVLSIFFVGGLVLAFTPCVLPMIPILSGLIVGQGANVTPARGFSLAFVYVQGMALTYAIAGAIFVLVFKQAPAGFFQQPWIVALFCALFVLLALAMFGVFTLQLPSALQTRLTGISNQQKSGTVVGVLIMGALSALIVTACVAPAIVAALSAIAMTRDVFRGAAALYVAGLGMGVPLLLVGASAGALLPKVGAWMGTVKAVFGVVFLALALYFGQRLVPPTLAVLLWSVFTVVSGYWIFSLKSPAGTPAPAPVRAPGLIMVVYGIILLIGASAGATDPLQPLSARMAVAAGEPAGSGPAGAEKPAVGASEGALAFETIKSVDDLNQRVTAASAAGKPVMLDFYADWCTSCKEMERYTFTDPSVQEALKNTVLLRADVTANDAQDQALLQHFGIFGPPTIAFYDATGQEQRNFRVVGYMKAPEFASVLRRAFAAGSSTSSTAAASTAPSTPL